MENLDVFVLALFCFIMGATLVGLVVYLRGGKAKNLPGENPSDPDMVEVAHLWRSRKTKRLVVELDEKIYISASELSSNQQQHLAGSAAVLQTWLAEGEPSKEPQPAAAAQPVPPTPLAAAKEPAKATAASPAQEVKPVAARPLDAINRAFISGPTQAAPKFKSIAAQINEVLQSRLPGSPFEAVGIHLIETPDQGVVVRVGSEEFAGVEAVPDPAVRAFIKAAVTEWEANTRTGIR
jgi:hypothetical protein